MYGAVQESPGDHRHRQPEERPGRGCDAGERSQPESTIAHSPCQLGSVAEVTMKLVTPQGNPPATKSTFGRRAILKDNARGGWVIARHFEIFVCDLHCRDSNAAALPMATEAVGVAP